MHLYLFFKDYARDWAKTQQWSMTRRLNSNEAVHIFYNAHEAEPFRVQFHSWFTCESDQTFALHMDADAHLQKIYDKVFKPKPTAPLKRQIVLRRPDVVKRPLAGVMGAR